MDILTNELNDVVKNTKLHIAVRAAAARGRLILDKYYAKTDDSIMYRMAMSECGPFLHFLLLTHIHVVLHPQYKTAYFEDEGWEREWIDEATDIITQQWDKYYKDTSEPVHQPAAQEVSYYPNHFLSYSLTISHAGLKQREEGHFCLARPSPARITHH